MQEKSPFRLARPVYLLLDSLYPNVCYNQSWDVKFPIFQILEVIYCFINLESADPFQWYEVFLTLILKYIINNS
jgi:hypothetical protein